MKLSEYAALDAVGLADLVRRGDLSTDEVAAAANAAMDLVNPRVNALAGRWPGDAAIAEDGASSAALAGVPFLIKDIAVHMKGKPTEFGSRLAEGLTPERDSYLMRRFRQAGLVTLGRTTSPEMAFSTTTESVFNGPTRNPWDTSCSSGGSSGGAAAAVASGMVPIAHATDAAGSIRVPAALCGLFGLKPTRGRVSNGPHLDEVFNGFGTQLAVSRSVRDTAVLLDAIQGAEPGDPYSAHPPKRPYAEEVATEPQRLRIGIRMTAWNGAHPDNEVRRVTEDAARLCRSLGHEVSEADMSPGMSWEAFVHANAQIWCGNLVGWVDDIAAAMGRSASEKYLEPSTLACYQYGRQVSADDFARALAARNTVARSAATTFEQCDLILTPTMPDVAPKIGTYEARLRKLDGLAWTNLVFEHAPYMAIFNVAGIPAMTVPLGMNDARRLPIGVQFGAAHGREDLLLRLAGQLEAAAPWHQRVPPVWAGR
jgi:amidase